MSDLPGLRQRYAAYERAWAAQRWDDWLATLAPDYTFTLGAGPARDRAATLAWSRGIFAAFPDYTQIIHRTYLDGHTLIVEATGSGTFSGPLSLGAGRPFPPTGRTFTLPYVKILTVDDHGLITHDRQHQDTLTLLAQLGIPPSPGDPPSHSDHTR